ncbi:MAG TPA: fluoride efflux transporter CrcB [Bacteroidia bacterium]|nr:fluoride efflux transporter CrcB [Bacteroidia bacterium]
MKGIELILLVVGALAGAFLRYKIVSSPMLLGALPLNVLFVNIIGSFILGIFSVVSAFWNLDTKYSILVAVGFCGSLTTMSSFALETSNLLDNRLYYTSTINVMANVLLSLGFLIGGRALASLIILRGG